MKDKIEELVKLFIAAVDEKSNSDKTWTILCDEKDDDGFLKLFKFNQEPHNKRLKVVFEVAQHYEVCFKFCTNIELRPTWDDMCLEAEILENIDQSTRIQYTRSRGIPLLFSPRDAVNIFHTRKLEDGRLLSLAFATEHEKAPLRKGVIRSEAFIISTIMERHPTNESHTIITQINETDAKGWIPASFIAKVVPTGVKKLRKVLKSL